MLNKELFEKLKRLSLADELPSHDYIAYIADKVVTVLENENTDYRESFPAGKPGGLLDFTKRNLPLVIIPDIHARSDFLQNILSFVPPKGFLDDCTLNLYEAVETGKVRIVCVGDILHSESRGIKRWEKASIEFSEGVFDGKAMRKEMQKGLASLCMIMECKSAFPKFFHCLKGNHENIMNQSGGGDFPFRKFADEGQMVKVFMQTVYGDDILMLISYFERNLPLAAVFDSCVVSHAEPRRAFNRKELICGMGNAEVVSSLTWTENNSAANGSVAAMLSMLTGRADINSLRYFGGHRPVKGNYALRQNNLYVQIHNPTLQNITLVYKNKIFDPETDIVNVKK